ncbi:MAG: SGNH/GDSL hydrolase family protein [Candidatus Omnitrophica bacterium]|nr:SGNH/GDSL hydrolase family protein [Candidatus Omnitrophota bacterium]
MKSSVPNPKICLKPVLRYALFLAISVAAGFIVLESLLRFFHVRPNVDFAYLPDFWTDRKILGIFAPNQIVHENLLIPYTYHINNQGLRGRDVALEKAPGELRVLVLGDSAAFGFYVKDEETFPAQLETALKEKFPERTVTVLNASSGGYTIKDEWLYLRSKGIRWNPDIVVVAFYSNDVLDLLNERSMWEGQRRNIEISWDDWWFSTGRLWKQSLLCKHLLAFQLRLRLWAEKFNRQGGGQPENKILDRAVENMQQLNEEHGTETVGKAWQAYESYLRLTKEFLDGKDIKLLVAAFADHSQIGRPDWTEPQSTLGSMCGRLNISFIDLLPYVRNTEKPSETFLLPRDTHPSATGYAIAANAVADFLYGWPPSGQEG